MRWFLPRIFRLQPYPVLSSDRMCLQSRKTSLFDAITFLDRSSRVQIQRSVFRNLLLYIKHYHIHRSDAHRWWSLIYHDKAAVNCIWQGWVHVSNLTDFLLTFMVSCQRAQRLRSIGMCFHGVTKPTHNSLPHSLPLPKFDKMSPPVEGD